MHQWEYCCRREWMLLKHSTIYVDLLQVIKFDYSSSDQLTFVDWVNDGTLGNLHFGLCQLLKRCARNKGLTKRHPVNDNFIIILLLINGKNLTWHFWSVPDRCFKVWHSREWEGHGGCLVLPSLGSSCTLVDYHTVTGTALTTWFLHLESTKHNMTSPFINSFIQHGKTY